MNILETNSLYQDYSGLKVLFDINLEVKAGERHAIIGPNGAGKTTLFNVITGTCRPSQGEVIFQGKKTLALGIQFQDLSPKLRGMLFVFADSSKNK